VYRAGSIGAATAGAGDPGKLSTVIRSSLCSQQIDHESRLPAKLKADINVLAVGVGKVPLADLGAGL
jgi:hypothetical protein